MKGPMILLVVALTGCGGNNTSSKVEVPGTEKDAKSKTLEAGAALIQEKSPLKQVNIYLNGFHFYNGNMNAQMEAHHYASKLNEDVHQAIIYDGNGEDAKIMGIEYIISWRLFSTLPEEEKRLWHSHRYEVKSGTLIAPGLPLIAEHELMEKLVSTYGKTIHTWHTDQKLSLPLGSPMIMMGFTKDGQVKPSMVSERDNRFQISTADRKRNRSDITEPVPDSMADTWQKGEVRQFVITNVVDSALKKHEVGH